MQLVTPEFGLLFWQLLTFLIVLFLLSRLAWKPIMGALREREVSIEEALREADRARLAIQQMQGQNEALLAETRAERDRILREAQQAGTQLIEMAKQRATEEGGRQIDAARSEIENQKRAALAEIRNMASALSLEIAEKLLRRELKDEAAQKALVTEYLKDVKLN